MPLPSSKFPTAVAGAPDLLVEINKTPSQNAPMLLAPMASGDTSFSTDSGSGSKLPTDNFTVSIDDEIIFVTSRIGDVCTVGARGSQGTTAASHSAGAPINGFITAQAHNQSAAEINAIENFLAASFGLPFAPFLPNLTIISLRSRTSTTGTLDLYTVPTGRRALIVTAFVINTSGSSMSLVQLFVKISGTLYPISLITNSFTSGTNRNISPVGNYVAEAGETISIALNQQPNTVQMQLFEFDNTSNLKSPKIFSPALATGFNTVYQVPVGKTAFICAVAGSFNFTALSGVVYSNNSGSSRSIVTYQVPNGGSPDATTQTAASTLIGSGTANFTGAVPSILASQDSLVVSTDSGTATQFAWTTVIER